MLDVCSCHSDKRWWQITSNPPSDASLQLLRLLLKSTQRACDNSLRTSGCVTCPFLKTDSLIIKPSNCTSPCGMGHCNCDDYHDPTLFCSCRLLTWFHIKSWVWIYPPGNIPVFIFYFFSPHWCGSASSSMVMLLLLLSKAVKCGTHLQQLTPLSVQQLHLFH